MEYKSSIAGAEDDIIIIEQLLGGRGEFIVL